MRNLRVILTGLIVMMLSLSAIANTAHALDRCEVPHGATYNIDEHSTCRAVTNNHASGQTIMVPTKSAAEWNTGANAFLNALPAGVTATACSSCGTITNCAAAGGGGVTPGSQTFSTAGSHSFTVPCHNTLTVQLWGGGGGGNGTTGGNADTVGVTGGASTWDGGSASGKPQANGGSKGIAVAGSFPGNGGGAGGTAVNCTTSTAGEKGGNDSWRQNNGNTYSGKGGNAGTVGTGGAAVLGSADKPGIAGTAPGGGGSGSTSYDTARGSTVSRGFPGGGGGAYCSRTYSSGTYTAGTNVTVVVGAGGAGGNSTYDGGAGAVGRVTITWN